MSATRTRIGGHLVVDCLEAAGAQAVFGVPGIHALAIWDGLVDSRLRYVGMRTELSAGFAADGYARAGGRPGVLLTTTGPGSFVATCALMEARTSYVPLVNIVSQVPRDVIGTNRGFLHELPTQSQVLASFAKWHAVARGIDEVPDLIAEAFRQATSAPSGPGRARDPGRRARGRDRPAGAEHARRRAGARCPLPIRRCSPRPRACSSRPSARCSGPAAACCARRARRRSSRSPSASARPPPPPTWARARSRPTTRSRSARPATRARSRSCCAPPTSCSPSAPSSAPRRPGSGRSTFEGRLIQVDARAEHLGATYEGLGIARRRARRARGARAARLAARLGRAGPRPAVHERISSGLATQGRDAELHLLADLRDALGPRRHPRLRHDADRATSPRRSSTCTRPARSSTRSAPARSATPGPPRSAPRSRGPTRRCSRCTATAACSTTCSSCSRRGSTGSAPSCSWSTTAATGSCASTRRAPTAARARSTSRSPTSRRSRARSASRSSRRARARSPARSPRRSRSTGLPSSTCRRRSSTRGDALMDLALTPELIEIQQRSRRFLRRAPAARRAAVRARGRPAARDARAHRRRRHRRAAARREHARASGAARATRWLEQVISQEQLGRSTNALWDVVWRPAQRARATATTSSASATCCPRSSGERRYAYAITEPQRGLGREPARRRARVRTTGGWRIDGEKWFVTDADVADYLIVVADAEGHGPTRVPVDQGTAGLRETRRPRYMHTFVYEHPEYVLEDCEVPDAQVLGGLGQGHELSREWFIDERLMIAARCLGGAERALEIALEYACEREQFGAADRRLPGRLVPARSMRGRARRDAGARLPGGLGGEHAASTARRCTRRPRDQAATRPRWPGRVVDRACRCSAAAATCARTRCERLYRDLRVDRIWEGTSEIQRMVVVNELRQARPGRGHRRGPCERDAPVGRARAPRAADRGRRARDRAQGYEAATLRDVARRGRHLDGTSSHYYFEGKDDLFAHDAARGLASASRHALAAARRRAPRRRASKPARDGRGRDARRRRAVARRTRSGSTSGRRRRATASLRELTGGSTTAGAARSPTIVREGQARRRVRAPTPIPTRSRAATRP